MNLPFSSSHARIFRSTIANNAMKLPRPFLDDVLFRRADFAGATSVAPESPAHRLGYTVRKRTVNPQGDMKNKIDALDAQLTEATRRQHRRSAAAAGQGDGPAGRQRMDRRAGL